LRRYPIGKVRLTGHTSNTNSPSGCQPMMLKRILGICVLLALASVQMFAAGCELRCAVMALMPGHGACGHQASVEPSQNQIPHCHGAIAGLSRGQPSVTGDGSCGASVCRVRLEAITNHPETLVSTTGWIWSTTQHFGSEFPPTRSSAPSMVPRSPRWLWGIPPLDERPGSSLRI
jgi:hypothetical protein